MHEKHLIFVVVDKFRELSPAANQIARSQLTFEYGELKVIPKTSHGLENLTETFVVTNVVTDKIRLPH